MCQKCDVRALFGDGPCNQCAQNQEVIKSASNVKNVKPYYVVLSEHFGGQY